MPYIHFTPDEMAQAQRLKQAGLPWQPQPGNFVYDPHELIEAPSPFQERVYFILDLKHFLRRAASLEDLKEKMIWLPTWEDARALLAERGVEDEEIARRLQQARALHNKTERLLLYAMLEEALKADSSA